MCNGYCKVCPFNNNCIVKKEREKEVKTIFEGTNNQQEVKSE